MTTVDTVERVDWAGYATPENVGLPPVVRG